MRSRASASQSSWDSRIPSITASSTRSPCSVKPQATRTPSLGPSRRTGRKTASKNKGRQLDVVEIAAPELLEAVAQLLADPRGGRLRELPQPGLLAQRFDVAHRQAADERADHHRLQRLGAQQLRAAREQLGDERLRRLADLGYLDRKLALGGLHPARAKAVAQPRRRLRPPLIPGAAQPRVELLLNRPLDDQAGAELRELRQRLARILADPDGQQPVDLLLDLRRRRYRPSHGVGPPSSSCQDLREPTPCPRRARRFTALVGRDHRRCGADG